MTTTEHTMASNGDVPLYMKQTVEVPYYLVRQVAERFQMLGLKARNGVVRRQYLDLYAKLWLCLGKEVRP